MARSIVDIGTKLGLALFLHSADTRPNGLDVGRKHGGNVLLISALALQVALLSNYGGLEDDNGGLEDDTDALGHWVHVLGRPCDPGENWPQVVWRLLRPHEHPRGRVVPVLYARGLPSTACTSNTRAHPTRVPQLRGSAREAPRRASHRRGCLDAGSSWDPGGRRPPFGFPRGHQRFLQDSSAPCDPAPSGR
jgi:hypothetical protein